jgi:hypothetical protein
LGTPYEHRYCGSRDPVDRGRRSADRSSSTGLLRVWCAVGCAVVAVTVSTGCESPSPAIHFAPARLPEIQSILADNGDPVAPDANGAYEVLPAHRSLLLKLLAPWPNELGITIDGVPVDRVYGSGTDLDTAYWFVTSFDLNTSPTQTWNLRVLPTLGVAECASQMTITIRSVSDNPSYSGTDKVSDPLTLRLLNPSPPRPFDLAVAPGVHSAALQWTAVNHATAYAIDRRTVAGDFTQVARVDPDASGALGTTFLDTGLAAGTGYAYRVRALGAAAGCDTSATATIVTRADHGVLSLQLTPVDTADHYEASVPSGSLFVSPGAVITSMTNTAHSLASPPSNDIDFVNLKHAATTSTRVAGSLAAGTSSQTFNGMPVFGDWELSVTNISAVFLFSGCTGPTNVPNWWQSCTDRATVSMSIDWNVP